MPGPAANGKVRTPQVHAHRIGGLQATHDMHQRRGRKRAARGVLRRRAMRRSVPLGRASAHAERRSPWMMSPERLRPAPAEGVMPRPSTLQPRAVVGAGSACVGVNVKD
eukprot:scaffold7523_cov132-Isochrysis_galbana.AAC.8